MSFTNSQLMELKALNIIKSLVIRSTSNETGFGVVFCRVFRLFFRWVYPKKKPTGVFFWYLPGFLNPVFHACPLPANPHNQFSAPWLK